MSPTNAHREERRRASGDAAKKAAADAAVACACYYTLSDFAGDAIVKAARLACKKTPVPMRAGV
ncbi:MAG: hypothetical protein A3F74_02445 [Betaproteobacteria bacterium RIFCSPLOWO2_12_FULL_62_58]|nr:MAG: hypothetical protein A3I62_02655 [Betaproteobacteria bacterium RIFCSPLOWO2_02_FULL_62_79]OGA53644.1 MAG: hypothetical protein A3F74_02445 [Betaproteobacteria bacterium RIFCSPLOWO2_12_FULL_62_58]